MQEYSFRRLKKILFLNLARFQMPGAYRAKMLKLGGIVLLLVFLLKLSRNLILKLKSGRVLFNL